MSARDIDLTYADDGRTLQHALLVEDSVVQLPGSGGSAGSRIAAKTIDMAMGPDGRTLTNLNATENVQVDLPADGAAPAKRIRSATLTGMGAPGTGLQNATFGGNVEYREARRGAAERGRNRPRRAVADAGREDEAGLRRRRAGGLPRQRPFHRRPSGRRRRPARALSRRKGPDRPVDVGRARTADPARQRRPRHGRSPHDRVRPWHAQAEGRHEGAKLHAAVQEKGGRRTGGRRGRAAGGKPRAGPPAVAPQAGRVRHRHVQPARLRWPRRTRGVQRQRAALAGRHHDPGRRITVDDKTGNLEATGTRADRDDPGSGGREDGRPHTDGRRRGAPSCSSTTTPSAWRPTPTRRTWSAPTETCRPRSSSCF